MAGIADSHPIDVSVTIRPGMPVYPGDPGVDVSRARSIERGDPANVTRLDIGAHTGTHIDAPCHFLPGAPGASDLPADRYVGRCVVADATGADGAIGADVIESAVPAPCDKVLLKTRNSRLWDRDGFASDFVRLDMGGAAALLARGAGVVGIDYLSIGDHEAHIALFERGVGVIEGLDLRAVSPGPYLLVCLPLRIAGSDGAPARALLWPLAA